MRLLTKPPLQGLMRISDYQRRRILHLIKHFKSAHKQQQATFSGAHSWNGASALAPGRLSASRAASMPRSSTLAPGSPRAAPPVSSGLRASIASSACLLSDNEQERKPHWQKLHERQVVHRTYSV